jgi:hypothetical protein
LKFFEFFLIEQGDVLWCAGGFCVEHMEEFELKRDGEIETVRGLPKTLTLDGRLRATAGSTSATELVLVAFIHSPYHSPLLCFANAWPARLRYVTAFCD